MSGYYSIESESGIECQACGTNCTECNSASQCLQCIDSHYAVEGTSTCNACSPQCKSCNGVAHNCTSCFERHFLESRTRNCIQCHTSCQECIGSSDDQCISCAQSYFLVSETKTCVTQCPPKLQADSASRECLPWQAFCSSWTGTSFTTCAQCIAPFYLFNGTCVKNCPSELVYRDEQNRECKPCNEGCLTCSYGGSCLSCKSSYFMHDTNNSPQCVRICPVGTLAQNSTRQCRQCHHTCRLCSGLTSQECTDCNSDRFLFNNMCLTECPQGYYNMEGVCFPCPAGCITCISSRTCITCQTGLRLPTRGGLCFSNICDSTCASCSGPGPNNCTSLQLFQRISITGYHLSISVQQGLQKNFAQHLSSVLH